MGNTKRLEKALCGAMGLLLCAGCAQGESTAAGDFDDPWSRRGEVKEGWFVVAQQRVHLSYEDVDGDALFQGDIQLEEPDGFRNAVYGLEEGFWPDGVVPYVFAPDFESREMVLEAMSEWERKTNIRFERADGSTPDFVRFENSTGCSSLVGRTGGEQPIKLHPQCSASGAVHEIGHTLGLWHTQSRSDRDEHVTIHWDEILAGREHNFLKNIDVGLPSSDVGPYDLSSIMHYDSPSFARGAAPTITRKDGGNIPRTFVLTEGDAATINYLYPPAQIPNEPDEPDGDTISTVPLFHLRIVDFSQTPPIRDHFLTADPSERDWALEHGFDDAGVVAHVWPADTPGTAPVHRFYHPRIADHFITPIRAEVDWLRSVDGAKLGCPEGAEASADCWHYNRVTFSVDAEQNAENTPLYRLYCPYLGAARNHRYTTKPTVRDSFINGGCIEEDSGAFVYTQPTVIEL